MERRSDRSTQSASRTVVDAKMSLSLWLRAGRANKGLSLEDVAKITKIQQRILERLEAGKLEGLPAEVFVRGFVRSYARCVGLDEAEALQRYSTAAGQPTAPSASARALVESMTELAPAAAGRAPKHLRRDPRDAETDIAGEATFAGGSLAALPKIETVTEMLLPETGTLMPEPVVSTFVAVEPIEPISESTPSDVVAPVIEVIEVPVSLIETKPVEHTPVETRSSKKKRGKKKRKAIATGTPADPTPVIETSPAPATEEIVVGAETTHVVADVAPVETADVASEGATSDAATDVSEPTETWAPKMPTVVAASVPWRRPYASTTSTAPVVPTIVIDDADPDSAEREIEERAAQKEPARRSFLPPILLDREDRSSRQGGLTLAVIILLIAATLTLSYLMRRPSSTGDGVTQAPITNVVPDVVA